MARAQPFVVNSLQDLVARFMTDASHHQIPSCMASLLVKPSGSWFEAEHLFSEFVAWCERQGAKVFTAGSVVGHRHLFGSVLREIHCLRRVITHNATLKNIYGKQAVTYYCFPAGLGTLQNSELKQLYRIVKLKRVYTTSRHSLRHRGGRRRQKQ